MFLYLGYPVLLWQLSVLLLIAFLSSVHISLLVPTLALFNYCVSVCFNSVIRRIFGY